MSSVWMQPISSSSNRKLLVYFDSSFYKCSIVIDKSHIFTNLWLIEDFNALFAQLDKLNDQEYTLAGNLVQFAIDNNLSIDESKYKLYGSLERSINEFNSKTNRIQFIGLEVIKQVYHSSQYSFSQIEWIIKRLS